LVLTRPPLPCLLPYTTLFRSTSATGTITFDDKGLVFRVCLGMPHDTHSDDALRAVRAGLDIRARLSALGLSSAVGVAAGFGVCIDRKSTRLNSSHQIISYAVF